MFYYTNIFKFKKNYFKIKQTILTLFISIYKTYIKFPITDYTNKYSPTLYTKNLNLTEKLTFITLSNKKISIPRTTKSITIKTFTFLY